MDVSDATRRRRYPHNLPPRTVERAEELLDAGLSYAEAAGALMCSEAALAAAVGRRRNPNPNSGRIMLGIMPAQLPDLLAFASDPEEARHRTFDTVTRLAKIGVAALAAGFRVPDV